jgi:Ca-activated chloride channel homolog
MRLAEFSNFAHEFCRKDFDFMKVFSAAIFVLLFALSIFAQQQAEIVVASTHLRKAPDYKAEIIQTLAQGERVTFQREREASGWFYVSLASGVKGWIRSTSARAVKAEEKIAQPVNQAASKPTPKPKPTPAPSENVSNSAPISTPPTVSESNSNPPSNTLPTPAATTDEDNEVVRIETAEVSLYVRVLDGGNRPVSGLKQTDFKVFENGELQPITSLTVAEVPMISALVIDNSRSLRTQLKKVIEAGKILVGANKAADETAVVRFVSSDKIEVVQDFSTDKRALGDALDNLFVEGGQTAIIDAIYRTAKKINQYQTSGKKEDAKLRALILVSDGEDRGSANTEQQLFELLRNSDVQIYAVGFTNDLSSQPDASGVSRREKARNFLTRLAKETGGKVYFPDSLDELPKIAADISGELRTQYLISYAPTGEGNVSFRQIKVEVADGANNQKRTAVTRSGRSATPK